MSDRYQNVSVPPDREFCPHLALAEDLERVVRALLMFHSASPWDQAKDAEYNRLLWPLLDREPPATTKALCDAARAALTKHGRTP